MNNISKVVTIEKAVEKIFIFLEKEKQSKKAFILLDGSIGVGKTFLVSQLLEKYNVEFKQSPTYQTMISYKSQNWLYSNIHHIDLYHLQKIDDFNKKINVNYFEESGIYIIEWPIDKIYKIALNQANVIVNVKFVDFFKCVINIFINDSFITKEVYAKKNTYDKNWKANKHKKDYWKNDYYKKKKRRTSKYQPSYKKRRDFDLKHSHKSYVVKNHKKDNQDEAK